MEEKKKKKKKTHSSTSSIRRARKSKNRRSRHHDRRAIPDKVRGDGAIDGGAGSNNWSDTITLIIRFLSFLFTVGFVFGSDGDGIGIVALIGNVGHGNDTIFLGSINSSSSSLCWTSGSSGGSTGSRSRRRTGRRRTGEASRSRSDSVGSSGGGGETRGRSAGSPVESRGGARCGEGSDDECGEMHFGLC